MWIENCICNKGNCLTSQGLLNINLQRITIMDLFLAKTITTKLNQIRRKYVYANNKGVDQSAHQHSLISNFVIRCLDSTIPTLAISKVSRLWLASVA